MITYALAAKLFESFSILRWNDRLRPVELVEIDHHALKSMLTYFIGKTAQQSLSPQKINLRRIVDQSVVDLLCRISTSDIHSNVRKRLKSEQAFKDLITNDWEKPSLMMNGYILDILKTYVEEVRDKTIEYMIVQFSHKYVSSREFKIIEKFSISDDDLKQVENEINNDIAESIHPFFQREARDLQDEKSSSWLPAIMAIVERLRYQTRWSQTPRIPATSVLGHSMYCALLAYLMSIDAKLDDDRIVNNFYAALFHDLPEALSRDIISPVKKADESIAKLVEKIEKELCEEEIFSKIPEVLREDFRFVTGQMCPDIDRLGDEQLHITDKYDLQMQQEEFFNRREFSNRVQKDTGRYIIVPWGDDRIAPYDEPMDDYRFETGIDGKILKICDSIAAFMEARMSLQHGIRSPHLDNGISSALNACSGKHLYGLAVDEFFESITF